MIGLKRFINKKFLRVSTRYASHGEAGASKLEYIIILAIFIPIFIWASQMLTEKSEEQASDAHSASSQGLLPCTASQLNLDECQ